MAEVVYETLTAFSAMKAKDHLIFFCTRKTDPRARVVRMPVSFSEGKDAYYAVCVKREWVELEVPKNSYLLDFNTGGIELGRTNKY